MIFSFSRKSAFQYFTAETENDLSYKEVSDLVTVNIPSIDYPRSVGHEHENMVPYSGSLDKRTALLKSTGL